MLTFANFQMSVVDVNDMWADESYGELCYDSSIQFNFSLQLSTASAPERKFGDAVKNIRRTEGAQRFRLAST